MNIIDLILTFLTHFVVISLCGKPTANPNAKDFYERLGLKKGANDQEIKKAFKRLALEYHPDKNKDPNAQEEFTKIAEAYETLKDPQKRKNYDRGGFSEFFGGDHFDFNFGSFFQEFDKRFKGGNDGASRRGSPEFSSSPFSSFFDFGDDSFETAFADMDSGSFFGAGQMHSQIFNQDIYSDGHQRCTTTTRKVGNTIQTHTTCS